MDEYEIEDIDELDDSWIKEIEEEEKEYNSFYKEENDTIKIFGTSKNKSEYFWGHIKKSTQPTQTSNGYSYKEKELVMQRNGSWCEINLLTQCRKSQG